MSPIARIAELLDSAGTFWPAALTARRALDHVHIESLTEREERLLALAEELGPQPSLMLRSQMWVYIALAFLSFASNRALTLGARRASLAAAIALASNTIVTLRENMGLNEKLREMVGLDPELGPLVIRVVTGRPAGTIYAIDRLLDEPEWADQRAAEETKPTSE